jgi:hypothetical protein
MLVSHKKEWNADMDESVGHYVKWKKSRTERQKNAWSHSYVKLKEAGLLEM